MDGRELKALIFDLDGVLVDTVELHYRAWKQVCDEIGVPFSRPDMDQFRGVHRRDIITALAGARPDALLNAYLDRKDRLYKQLLDGAGQSILNPPVVSLLREARAHGLRVGLASSSMNARHVLDIVGFRPAFDVIADGNTVCRFKPAPDIFVWVAGALELRPEEIAVIEDGSAGVQAAVAAGMFAVGIDVDAPACPPHLNLSMERVSFAAIQSGFLAHSQPVPVSAS